MSIVSKIFIGVLVCMLSLGITAQNATDENGKRTGYWKITGAMSKEKGYDAEAIVEEGEYVKSRKNGLWKKYYPSGKIKSEVEYKNGRASGKFVTYFENGQLEEQGNWKSGKYTGGYEMYYEDGTPRVKKTFNETGATEGKVTMWYPNGKKEIEFNTKNGQEDGEAVWYFQNGDVKKKQNFSEGVSEPSQVFARVNEPYKDPNEKPKQKGPKMAGKLNSGSGLNDCYGKTYDDNKNILMDGCFKEGRLYNGKHYIYDEFGLLDHIKVYKEGAFVGNGVIGAKDSY